MIHLSWLGPLLTLLGFLSYYLFFAQIPDLRDIPWVNLPWVVLGSLLSLWGLGLVFRRRGWLSKLLSLSATVFALCLTALLFSYVFVLSYEMPPASTQTEQLERAPEFSLSDSQGNPVTLSDFRGQNVVLSFYRGHW